MATFSLDTYPEPLECSVYSAQPSETNCSIRELTGGSDVNADVSVYSVPKSETNVTFSEMVYPCPSKEQFDLSVYSVPKSETNVTMGDAQYSENEDAYSVYTVPPSETNVTMHDAPGSEFTSLPSETNVTMADGFQACHAMENLIAEQLGSEVTAVDGLFAGISYVEHLQLVHGISDDKIIGLEGSDRSIVKIIDSNECLLHLDEFEPVPVHFGGGNGYFL